MDGIGQPFLFLSADDPVRETIILQLPPEPVKKEFALFGMFTERIRLPWQINITQKIEVIPVFFNLIQNPGMTSVVFILFPYLCYDELGITKQQLFCTLFCLFLPCNLHFCYMQDVFLPVRPLEIFHILPGNLRHTGGLVMGGQLFTQLTFAGRLRTGNGNFRNSLQTSAKR